MRTSIKEYAGFELCGFEDPGLLISCTENLPDSGLPECLVRGKLILQFGQPTRKPGATAHRKPILAAPPGFNQPDVAVGVPIVVEHAQCVWPIEFVHGVASPIPDRQIQSAIAVEIPRSDTRPPSCPLRESPLSCHVLEATLLISEDADWTPFDCQREVRMTIAVQIGEGGAAHKPQRFERLTGGTARAQLAVIVQPESRKSRLRISAWLKSSTHKQIQVAVAVDIRHRQRAKARLSGHEMLRRRQVRRRIN